MVPSKYVGRITILSIVALMLAVSSLMLPWYSVGVSTRTDYGLYDESYTYYIDGWSKYGSDTINRYHSWENQDLKQVMTSPLLLVWIWFFALLAFLVILFDGSPSIVPGLVLIAPGIIALVYFAVKMPDVISTDEYGSVMPAGHNLGFFGSHHHTYPEQTWTYGPAFGWFVLVGALAIQIAVVVLRTFAVVFRPDEPEEQEEERGPAGAEADLESAPTGK